MAGRALVLAVPLSALPVGLSVFTQVFTQVSGRVARGRSRDGRSYRAVATSCFFLLTRIPPFESAGSVFFGRHVVFCTSRPRRKGEPTATESRRGRAHGTAVKHALSSRPGAGTQNRLTRDAAVPAFADGGA